MQQLPLITIHKVPQLWKIKYIYGTIFVQALRENAPLVKGKPWMKEWNAGELLGQQQPAVCGPRGGGGGAPASSRLAGDRSLLP